jgi:hypothetical protein
MQCAAVSRGVLCLLQAVRLLVAAGANLETPRQQDPPWPPLVRALRMYKSPLSAVLKWPVAMYYVFMLRRVSIIKCVRLRPIAAVLPCIAAMWSGYCADSMSQGSEASVHVLLCACVQSA